MRPLLDSEYTTHSQNCHPVATQQLLYLEQELVIASLPFGTQLPPSRHKQVGTSAHLPQHLQQFIVAHKHTLHHRTPVNVTGFAKRGLIRAIINI